MLCNMYRYLQTFACSPLYVPNVVARMSEGTECGARFLNSEVSIKNSFGNLS
jgi:hypothetical protein